MSPVTVAGADSPYQPPLFQPTADELRLIDYCVGGGSYTAPAGSPAVRAIVLRRLLFGPAFESGSTVDTLVLEGVHVEGELDLSNGPLDSSELGPLIFRSCTFKDGVNLNGLRARRLSFEKSQFTWLDARWCRVAGPVDLTSVSGIAPASDDAAVEQVLPCAIDFRGARIEGNIILVGAQLRGPDQAESSPRKTAYALDLTGATVQGEMLLEPDFRAVGGINLRDLDLTGSLWASGAQVVATSQKAIFGQNAKIAGWLAMRERESDGTRTPFRAEGLVSLIGLRVGGIDMDGARFTSGLELNLSNIDADLRLFGTTVGGTLNAEGASIGHDLYLGGAASADASVDPPSTPTSDTQRPTPCAKEINLRRARISGNFDVYPVRVEKSLDLSFATVGGSVHIYDLSIGELHLEAARIEANVTITKLTLETNLIGPKQEHLWRGLHVGGKLQIVAAAVAPNTEARRAVDATTEVRARRLACYPGWSLVEADTTTQQSSEAGTTSTHPAAIAFLWSDSASVNDDGVAVILTGESRVLHDFNEVNPPQIRSRQGAADYLGVYTSYLDSGGSRFRLLDPDWARDSVALGSDGQSYELETTVHYQDAAFFVSFIVRPNATVKMVSDRPIEWLEAPEKWQGYLRVGTNPDAPLLPGVTSPAPLRFMNPPGLEAPTVRARVRRFRTRLRQFWIPGRLLAWERYRWTPVRDGGKRLWLRKALSRHSWTLVRKLSKRQRLLNALTRATTPPPIINLNNATVGRLDDKRGSAFQGDVVLLLDGLTYRNEPLKTEELLPLAPPRPIGGPRETAQEAYEPWPDSSKPASDYIREFFGHPAIGPIPWNATAFQRRRHWLDLQFRYGQRNTKEFRPHPYDALVSAFRADGNHEAARRTLSLKLTVERRFKGIGARFIYWLYWAMFDYGLSPRRALVTSGVYLLAGWLGVAQMSQRGVLVAPPAAVEAASPSNVGAKRTERTPCRLDLRAQALYALDAMLPVDLHQDDRCKIVGVKGQGFWLEAPTWEVLKTLYGLLGTLVFSIATLTVSGFLRRQAEP